MMARHPKRDQLARWLDGHESDPKLDEHLETCAVCASTLDTISLSTSNDNPEPSDIGPALLELLQPPEDLHERVSDRLAERLQRRQDIEILGSMLGVPREVGEIVATGSSPDIPALDATGDDEEDSEPPTS